MSDEERDVSVEQITEAIATAIVGGWTVLLAGFTYQAVEEFAVGMVEAIEEDAVTIDIVVPGREYRVIESGAQISTCILSDPGMVPIRTDREVLVIVIADAGWPEGVEQQAGALFCRLLEQHPRGGAVIYEDQP